MNDLPVGAVLVMVGIDYASKDGDRAVYTEAEKMPDGTIRVVRQFSVVNAENS